MRKSDQLLGCFAVAVACLPGIANAYLGPGGGITAIGALLALLAAVLYTFFGFFWYPIKRMLNKGKSGQDNPATDTATANVANSSNNEAVDKTVNAKDPQ